MCDLSRTRAVHALSGWTPVDVSSGVNGLADGWCGVLRGLGLTSQERQQSVDLRLENGLRHSGRACTVFRLLQTTVKEADDDNRQGKRR